MQTLQDYIRENLEELGGLYYYQKLFEKKVVDVLLKYTDTD